MIVYYRISDTGYNKVKPDYINNETCIKNFRNVFFDHIYNIHVIADNCSDSTIELVKKYIVPDNIEKVSIGHGAGTFNLALDRALNCDDNEIVYFVENDYLHKPYAPRILQEGFELGASFVSLYDHPDKYLDPSYGGNPYCEGGAEETRIYLTKSAHWKITNSTTMTFASTVKNLKLNESILRKWTSTSHPNDFEMWLDLRAAGQILITPIPGYSTHGESAWLSPLTNWEQYATSNTQS